MNQSNLKLLVPSAHLLNYTPALGTILKNSPVPSIMTGPTISSLLRRAAVNQNTGIITYPSGKTTHGLKTSYLQLLKTAEHNAKSILAINKFKEKSIVLIHLDDLFDSITLFWSVILAGGVPCISTPFTNISAQREKHIKHLHTLLDDPICITR